MNRRGAGLALAALLAGCGGLGSAPAQRYFVLETAPSRLAPGALQRDAMLLVAPTTASSFYDTQEIIYSRRSGERAYYQLSSWTEPPNRALATPLEHDPEHRQRDVPADPDHGGEHVDREIGVVRRRREREEEDRPAEQERSREDRVEPEPSEGPCGSHRCTAVVIHGAPVNDIPRSGSRPVLSIRVESRGQLLRAAQGDAVSGVELIGLDAEAILDDLPEELGR